MTQVAQDPQKRKKSAKRTRSEKLRKWNKERKAEIQRSPGKVSELSVYKCNKRNKGTRETETKTQLRWDSIDHSFHEPFYVFIG